MGRHRAGQVGPGRSTAHLGGQCAGGHPVLSEERELLQGGSGGRVFLFNADRAGVAWASK